MDFAFPSQRLAEALVECGAGGATFFCGVSASQLLLRALRISAATPLLAPALGLAAVGASAAAATAAALTARELEIARRAREGSLFSGIGALGLGGSGGGGSSGSTSSSSSSSSSSSAALTMDDVRAAALRAATRCSVFAELAGADVSHGDGGVALAALGLAGRGALAAAGGAAVFRLLLGGRFAAVAPSDLRHLGAFARPREALPAAGAEYATAAQRGAIQAVGRRHGCHTCGDRRARYHADHMPPNAFVKRANAAPWRRLLRVPPQTQRFFPQCEACSGLQGRAVRLDARVLRTHVGALRLHHATGVLAPAAAAAAEAAWLGAHGA